MWKAWIGRNMIDSNDKAAQAASDGLNNFDLRRREEMLREYYCVQDFIDRYGERRLKVKSWSVTSCGVALGFGLVENSSILFCLAAFGSLVFWYLEGLWRTRQSVLFERAYALEALLAQDSKDYAGPEISATFSRLSYLMDSTPLMRSLLYRSVRLPHFFIFCLGILLFLGSLLSPRLQAFITP
jgi:hypothetical protein